MMQISATVDSSFVELGLPLEVSEGDTVYFLGYQKGFDLTGKIYTDPGEAEMELEDAKVWAYENRLDDAFKNSIAIE